MSLASGSVWLRSALANDYYAAALRQCWFWVATNWLLASQLSRPPGGLQYLLLGRSPCLCGDAGSGQFGHVQSPIEVATQPARSVAVSELYASVRGRSV